MTTEARVEGGEGQPLPSCPDCDEPLAVVRETWLGTPETGWTERVGYCDVCGLWWVEDAWDS